MSACTSRRWFCTNVSLSSEEESEGCHVSASDLSLRPRKAALTPHGASACFSLDQPENMLLTPSVWKGAVFFEADEADVFLAFVADMADVFVAFVAVLFTFGPLCRSNLARASFSTFSLTILWLHFRCWVILVTIFPQP